ncbi:MAG: aspartate aminotransferase family protein [Hyphomicrobiaceae bacterium TMED74]|nr:acetylornithine transaminase [Filomicrobium sp.]RPG34827.1 MAG: aspartate aminotransferase family protein [Hyphomicrobiaceae bacterium TMED74]
MGTYGRFNIVFERGEGSWLISNQGERYLDFGSGIAVNTLGHAHPDLISALTEQAAKVWHTSNLYRIEGQERLAEMLCEASFAEAVFFCNSGAEACEGAIKLARRYHFANGQPERNRIITFEGSFHGRTLATIAAAGNPKHLEGFGPEAPGFDRLPFADHDAVEKAITDETAAIMIEPVMGEGGIKAIPKECLQGLRALCDKHGLLLVIDEVQTGIGRSGKLFAYEWADIKPDVMAIAKGIGGGFPLGTVMATNEAAKGMVPGTHGSTFGGNPLGVAVGCAVLAAVLKDGFLEDVQQKASRLRQALAELEDKYPDMVEEVRGLGLLTGLKLKPAVGDVVNACFEEQLLTVPAGDNVIRLIPPLNVSNDELSDAVSRIGKAFEKVRQK